MRGDLRLRLLGLIIGLLIDNRGAAAALAIDNRGAAAALAIGNRGAAAALAIPGAVVAAPGAASSAQVAVVPAQGAPVSAAPRVVLYQSLPAGTDLGIKELGLARDAWLDLCRGAQRTLDIGQFYATTQAGSDLEPVLAALQRAGARGVKIRFLVDGLMRKDSEPTLARLRAVPNLELRVIDWARRSGGMMHAKYWVADGARAYLGSQNFDWRALQHIHEIGALINDAPIARQVAAVFQLDWDAAAAAAPSREAPTQTAPAVREPPPPAVRATAPPSVRAEPVEPPRVGPPLELCASPPQLLPPGVRWSLPAIIDLLGRAQRTARLQLLTYSPQSGHDYWPALDSALRQAAVRGVKVQIILSSWAVGRPAIDHLKSLAALPNIAVRIVTIPPAAQGFIPFARVVHSKYLVLDDEAAVVGTSNWSRSYFQTSRNLELILRLPEPVAQLGAVFDQLWGSRYAEPLDLQKTYAVPRRDAAP